ncbi:MAG: hypothetical protein QXJ77_03125 [Candidatus Bathyarchaeia archaeon]
MKAITRHLRRFRLEKRGLSNVLVVMLSLILITVIVANVVLWSYQMSQFDWERSQENVKIQNVKPLSLRLENSNLIGTFTEEKTLGGEWKSHSENYTLLGGTQLVSGEVSNLWDEDDNYMKFRSRVSGVTYYFVTKETAYTVSSTQYSDYLSLSFQSENQADYLVLGYIELTCSSTSRQAHAQFVQDSTVLARYMDRPKIANSEVMPQMFAYIYKGTGDNVTFKWQIAVSSLGASVTAQRGGIYVIRLDNLPNIEYTRDGYSPAEQQNVDNVWGNAQGDTYEVTINPSTAGYYLIWASAKVESDSTSSSVSVRLNIDNGLEYVPYLIGGESTWSYARIEDTSTSEEHCFAIVAVRYFTAGSHSIKFQIADVDATASADWQYISLLAIRLTDVFEFYTNSTVTQAQTTQTVLQTYTSLNIPSERAGNYLILGGITTRGSSTSFAYETALAIDDVVYGRQQITPQDIYDYVPKVFIQNITLNSNPHTIATKYRTLNSAMTVYVKNSDILAIRLPPPRHIAEVEFIGDGGSEEWLTLNWTADGKCTTDNVATTFQLYRTDGYPNSGDGYVSIMMGTSDTTISQTITVNATSFRDPTTGKWKLKVKAVKETLSPFELWLDFIELKAQLEEKTYSLFIKGDFTINLTKYPVENISSIGINISLKASDTGEGWLLEAYNWMDQRYDIIAAFPPTLHFKDYAVSLGDSWQCYINPNNGTVRIALRDENSDSTPTTVSINTFTLEATLKYGVVLTLKNEGASTVHIVAIWVTTRKTHIRYDADFFISPGETVDYAWENIPLPMEDFTVKIVTERGNMAVFSRS